MRASQAVGIFALAVMSAAVLYAAESKPAARKIQKVAIVALARDGARAAEVEVAVKQNFTAHGVASESLRALAQPKPTTVQDLAQVIQSQGYDSLLCMGPRKTIRITPADTTGKFASLKSCLNSYLTGTYPTGEPLDVYPVMAEASPIPQASGAGSLRSPIPTNPAAAPLAVFKGMLRVFDTGTQALLWETSINTKMPAELREGLQTKILTHEINAAIEKSGLLPKP